MAVGSFSLVLHSHLPYYRKAGMWPFGEENLYEAIAETYIPLLNACEELRAEGIAAKLTIGITPVLAEQLADEHLKAGYEQYIADILERIEKDQAIYAETDDPRRELAAYYHGWYSEKLTDFQARYKRDLLAAFKALQDAGSIEIITSAATHGFSPLLSRDSSLNGQFKVGVQTYEKYFGRKPMGVWLPECAYRPGYETDTEQRPPIEQFLHENGLQYFFTDSHAVLGGTTSGLRRHIGMYGNIEYIPMPERPVSGLTTFNGYWLPEAPVAVYARNEEAGYQVWSADQGYPGDGWYREFHKKDGNSGMQYWRITGPKCDLAAKDFYNPQMALERIHEHSDHYVALIYDMLKRRKEETGEEGHIVVPFDTELFGHWWFEGVEWVKQVIRKMAMGSGIRRETVGEHMAVSPPSYAFQLPESTWGAGGHYHVWLNPDVEFMWPIIHRCESRMEELVASVPTPATQLQKRALDQAARELLLLEGSDWPFLVTTGQAKAYAIERFNTHVERFDALADAIMTGALSEELVSKVESIDNAFADVDYRLFANRQTVSDTATA